jgi:hypothetical protein
MRSTERFIAGIRIARTDPKLGECTLSQQKEIGEISASTEKASESLCANCCRSDLLLPLVVAQDDYILLRLLGDKALDCLLPQRQTRTHLSAKNHIETAGATHCNSHALRRLDGHVADRRVRTDQTARNANGQLIMNIRCVPSGYICCSKTTTSATGPRNLPPVTHVAAILAIRPRSRR